MEGAQATDRFERARSLTRADEASSGAARCARGAGGYFVVNGIERLIRLLIVPRRHHVRSEHGIAYHLVRGLMLVYNPCPPPLPPRRRAALNSLGVRFLGVAR